MQTLMVLALLLANTLISLETTILNTVAIKIVDDIGEKNLVPWVFAVYILGSTTFIPVFGKWAAKLGRKKIFMTALAVFAIGNLGCALSKTMETLIFFRLIAGIAAAGILPISNIIIGDIFTIKKRAKLQGHISLIWGIGALIGPFVGALIVTALSWRWLFFLAVPITIIIFVAVVFGYKDTAKKVAEKINYQSIIYFIIGSVSILAYTMNTTKYWLILIALLFSYFFIKNERRSKIPFLPIPLLKNKTVVFFILNSFLIFLALFGMENYIPTYLQTFQGVTIILSGLILAGISVGWMVSSYLLSPLMKKMKYTNIVLMGNTIAFVSVLIMLFYKETTHWSVMLVILLLQGISYGFVQTCSTLAVYEIVEEEHKSIASSLQSFSRNLGTAFSIGYLGNLLVNNIEHMMQYASVVAIVLISFGIILHKKIIPKV